jgi:hypothetical protein
MSYLKRKLSVLIFLVPLEKRGHSLKIRIKLEKRAEMLGSQARKGFCHRLELKLKPNFMTRVRKGCQLRNLGWLATCQGTIKVQEKGYFLKTIRIRQ